MGTNKAEEILHKHYSLASGMEYEHKTIIKFHPPINQ